MDKYFTDPMILGALGLAIVLFIIIFTLVKRRQENQRKLRENAGRERAWRTGNFISQKNEIERMIPEVENVCKKNIEECDNNPRIIYLTKQKYEKVMREVFNVYTEAGKLKAVLECQENESEK